MVTGHSPFHGDSATTVCFKVVNRDPMPPSAFDLDLPSALDALIFRAMAKDPAERYQNGAELANDLHELRQQYKPGTTSTTVGPLSRATSGSFRIATTSSARSSVAREKRSGAQCWISGQADTRHHPWGRPDHRCTHRGHPTEARVDLASIGRETRRTPESAKYCPGFRDYSAGYSHGERCQAAPRAACEKFN